jgi:hypothetical protein
VLRHVGIFLLTAFIESAMNDRPMKRSGRVDDSGVLRESSVITALPDAPSGTLLTAKLTSPYVPGVGNLPNNPSNVSNTSNCIARTPAAPLGLKKKLSDAGSMPSQPKTPSAFPAGSGEKVICVTGPGDIATDSARTSSVVWSHVKEKVNVCCTTVSPDIPEPLISKIWSALTVAAKTNKERMIRYLTSQFISFTLPNRRATRYGIAFAFFALLLGPQLSASATDFWISQSGSGSMNGSSSSNAASCGGSGQTTCAAFNNASNWGSGSSQIGAGTTIHLVGTIMAAAGATNYMEFQSGGASGNPVIVKFETGAQLLAPYWGGNGAIFGNGTDNVQINGGPTCGWVNLALVNCNGLIEATANGTGLANQQNGTGIFITASNHVEIENVQVSAIYVHTCTLPSSGCTDTNGSSTADIDVFPSSGQTDIKIHNVVTDNANSCITTPYEGAASAIQIYNYYVSNCNWHIAVGDGNSGASLTGLVIHDGVSIGFENWNTAADTWHGDGVFIFTSATTSTMTSPVVYNTRAYGPWGDCCMTSAGVYVDGQRTNNTNGITGAVIYNTVADSTGSTGSPASGLGTLNYDFASGSLWYNNTMIGSTSQAALRVDGFPASYTPPTMEDNIFSTTNGDAIGFDNSNSSFTASDYNVFYNTTGIAAYYMGGSYSTLAAWQASPGSPDLHSTTGNPQLTSYIPMSGSAASAGISLSSQCSTYTALCSDPAGTSRSSGNWYMGAFMPSGSPPPSSTSAPCPACFVFVPAPPTKLTAKVVLTGQ